MNIKDFSGITKTTKVKFISAENVQDDYYIIKLEKPNRFKWIPGEHAIFSIPGKKIKGKKSRAFSIASTPKEDVIMIGTRIGKEISSFKKTLINLKPGDEVKLRGPFGWFKIKDMESSMVLIATGVGITPIRALLMTLLHQHHRVVDVIYSSQFYMFKEDIDYVIEHNDTFSVNYLNDVEATDASLLEISNKHMNTAYYYVSGSSKAIKSISKKLKANGVKGNRIIKDPFLGY